LKEDESYSHLIQVLCGPQVSVKETDILKLLNYGLIIHSDNSFVAFSKHFHGFLRLIEYDEDIEDKTWKIIVTTEKKLRLFVHEMLDRKYQNDWIKGIVINMMHTGSTSEINWVKELVDRLVIQRNQYIELYQSLGSNNLLEYTSLADLFQLIKIEWAEVFKEIFNTENNNDLTYWEVRFRLLERIKHPTISDYKEINSEMIYDKAIDYCEEIMKKIK
jgi:hypothetical protein